MFLHTARAIVVVATLGPTTAGAGGLVVVSGSPRAIGRAGTGTVGDDGGGALLVNPAAMARREATRVQLGIGSVDDSIDWQSDTIDAPRARDQSGSHVIPIGAVEGAWGSWIIGVGAMTSAVSERSLRQPSGLPPDGLGVDFDYRYNGIHSFARRDTVTVGVARRVGDTVAVGVSVAASRIKLAETRREWAGFGDRDRPIGDPHHDVELELTGEDPLSPSAVAGVLVAPADLPLEFGASVAWTGRVRADGTALAFGTPSTTPSGMPNGTSTANVSSTGSIDIAMPWTLRAGVRYVSSRVVAEANGDLWIAPSSAESATWRVHGVRVVDEQSGAAHDIDDVPSRVSMRTHGAARASADVELIEGALWVTTGYAYTMGGTQPSRMSPTFGELSGHTFALGLETSAGGFTLTFGWSRTWWPRRHAPTSDLHDDNPFLAGDTTVMPGSYGGSSDQVGIVVDAELGTSR